MSSIEGSSSEIVDDHTPLRKYVTEVKKNWMGGGNWHWNCSYYLKTFNGSYSRVKAHLMPISEQDKNMCKG